MKSLMEIYTLQIKLLQGWKAEILQKHLSMRSFMEQVTKNSEVSVEGMKAMENRLKKDFLSLYQVLRGCETEWTSLVEKDISKQSTKETSSSDKNIQQSTPSSKEQGQ